MIRNIKFHAIAIGSICAVIVVLYQFMGPKPAKQTTNMPPAGVYIHLVNASWGLNCNDSIEEARQARAKAPIPKDSEGKVIPQPPLKNIETDNVLATVKPLCDGKISCSVIATTEALALDPIENCYKKLNVNYRCFDTDRLITSETNQGDILTINCAPQPAANNAPKPAPSQP